MCCNCNFNAPFSVKPVVTDAPRIWIARESGDHHTNRNVIVYFNPQIHAHESIDRIARAISEFYWEFYTKI